MSLWMDRNFRDVEKSVRTLRPRTQRRRAVETDPPCRATSGRQEYGLVSVTIHLGFALLLLWRPTTSDEDFSSSTRSLTRAASCV